MSDLNNSDSNAGGFSLAGSLIGGTHPSSGSGSGSNTKDTSAKLREGLTRHRSIGSSAAGKIASMANKSAVSSPDRARQRSSSHRRVASYRQHVPRSPKSPKSPNSPHKRSASHDMGSIKLPDSIPLSPSTDSADKHANNNNNKNNTADASASYTEHYFDYYSAATPGFKNAFSVLGSEEETSSAENNKIPPSSPPTDTAANARSPKSTVQTTIDSSTQQLQPHPLLATTDVSPPPSPTKSSPAMHSHFPDLLAQQSPSSPTRNSRSHRRSNSSSSSASNKPLTAKEMELLKKKFPTMIAHLEKDMPASSSAIDLSPPPSPTKSSSAVHSSIPVPLTQQSPSSPTRNSRSHRRTNSSSSSASNKPLTAKDMEQLKKKFPTMIAQLEKDMPASSSETEQKRTSRSASPSPFKRSIRTRSPSPARAQPKTTTRAASPMRAPSPLQSLKSKLAKSSKGGPPRQQSGKYHSDAVSKALEDESVSEKSKASSGSNSSPTKTSGSSQSPRRSKGQLKTRAASPMQILRSSSSKDTLDSDSKPNVEVEERGTTISSTPSFSLGKTSFRSMSPGRFKKNLKGKITSASPKRDRPTQPLSKLPLHPNSSEDGRSKNSFDEALDQITLTLGGTTMSFDVDDNKSSEDDTEEEEESISMSVNEPDMEENGCIINTTSFHIFERKEFLRAMGGPEEASSTVSHIQKGDSLCNEGGKQLDGAVQMYYAGLGTILSRIRDWTLERRQEERDASVSSGKNDAPPLSPKSSNLSYDDFVNAANCAEVNVLLIAMSTILLRTGNTHFRLRNFETACRDYASAQSYQQLRTKGQSNTGINESLVLEDAKLTGRIKNNMASALSKRQMFEEARSEYTKALQIKQSTLEALHKTTREKGGSLKDLDDKNLVSDIASTFHNIGLLRLNCDEPEKAEKAFKQSLSLRVKKFGLDDLCVSSTLNALGGLYYKTKRYDDSFRSYKESLRIWKLNGRKSDTAEHYYNIGLVFYAKGPYSKAKVSVAECAKIRRQAFGNVSLPVAESLYLFGKVCLSSGNYEEALDKFQEALAIRQKLLGKDHLLVSNVHLQMGEVYHGMEEYDKAMSSFSLALTIRSDRLGKYHASVAEVLHAIGSIYVALEEYSKALETLQEVLRIQREFLDPGLELAETLNTMSLVFYKSGDTERALELGEESLDILKSVAGFDHILLARVLKNTGDYHQDLEAYDDAMEAYGESLRIMASWLGREHILLSKTLSEVGVVRFKTGEYTTAKQSFAEALRIMRLPNSGADNSSIYPTLTHLGHAFYKNKELEPAAESYLESFKIQASIVIGEANHDLDGFSKKISSIEDEILSLEQSGDDTSELSSALGGIANILRYIGLVNQELGEFEQALYVNKLSLSVRLLQPFKDYSAIALMAETIAMFEFKLKNFAKALDYFNQALTAKKEYQGDVTIDVARTVNNLANIHFSLGNLDEAMELYQEALEIKKRCLGEDSDDVVNTLKNIAQVMVKAGKEQEAVEAYQSIVTIRQERYGHNHVSVAETLASLGDVYIKLGELDVAMTYFEQSINIQKSQEDGGTCDERILENLGSIYGKLGKWQKAESTFQEIVQMKRMGHGEDYLGVARTLDLLAVSYIEQERSSESIEHLKEALRIRKVCLEADDDEILASLNKLAFVYKSLDMSNEMEAIKSEFEAIQRGK